MSSPTNIIKTGQECMTDEFIDGKRIYRKRIMIEKVSGTDTTLDISNLNVDYIAIESAIIRNTKFKHSYAIPFYESEKVFVRIELDNDYNTLKIKSGIDAYCNGTVDLMLQYTKTTN